MSATLIAENRMALEPLIRAKLEAGIDPTRLGYLDPIPVGGLIEYLELLAGKSGKLPALFVYHDGDNPQNGTGSPHQIMMTQTWVVVIVTALERDIDGHADIAPIGRLMASVLGLLSGKKMEAELKPIAWVGNELMERSGLLFCYDIYSQPIDMR